MSKNAKAFVREVNKELRPVAKIVPYEGSASGDSFRVSLCKTAYLREDQVNTTKSMDALLCRLGEKHYGKEPMFNNTHCIFWFCNI